MSKVSKFNEDIYNENIVDHGGLLNLWVRDYLRCLLCGPTTEVSREKSLIGSFCFDKGVLVCSRCNFNSDFQYLNCLLEFGDDSVSSLQLLIRPSLVVWVRETDHAISRWKIHCRQVLWTKFIASTHLHYLTPFAWVFAHVTLFRGEEAICISTALVYKSFSCAWLNHKEFKVVYTCASNLLWGLKSLSLKSLCFQISPYIRVKLFSVASVGLVFFNVSVFFAYMFTVEISFRGKIF